MKVKSSKKRKILAVLCVVLISTLLITAGILKLIKDSRIDSSVEVLEKSKISNLFNIRQEEEEDDDEGFTIASPARSSNGTTTTSTSTPTSTGGNAQATSEKSIANADSNPVVSDPEPTTVVENTNNNDQSGSNNNEKVPVIPSDDNNTEDVNTPTIPNEDPVEDNKTDGHTITIKNSVPGHIYTAYQVFAGDLYEHQIIKDGKEVTEKVLSNIEWGAEFEPYGNDIIALLKEKNSALYNGVETAEDIAQALHNNKAYVDEFTVIVGDFIKSHDIAASGSTSGNDYKISGLNSGYYIVIDSQINPTDDSYSRYLIDVISDVTMEVKSTISTLRKTVAQKNVKDSSENGIDETRNTAIYYGEENKQYDIVFNLIAKMPDDITGYSKYNYTIVDIVDEGFDLQRDEKSNVIVTMKIGDKVYSQTEINYTVEEIKITEENYENIKDELKLEDEGFEYYKEKTILKIDIVDLLDQIKDGKITPAAEVVFEYNARLNDRHNVGYEENVNAAHLIYSDNPHEEDSTSKTTSAITYTYSIDLEISKIGKLNADEEKVFLPGAKFEIYHSSDKENPIATITTNSEGEAIGFASYSSLGSGTYYIREVESPDGYNKLREDIEITIDAVLKDDNSIEWKVSNKENALVAAIIKTKIVGEGEDKVVVPYVSLEVQNTSGFQLPITGGVGTILFTVIGLSLMIIAAVSLKSNKKK